MKPMENIDSRNLSNIETKAGTTTNITPKLTFNTDKAKQKSKSTKNL